MLLYLYERQRRDQVSRQAEIWNWTWTEWKKRPTLDTKSRRKWTWNTRYNTKCTENAQKNIESVVQIGHLLEDNCLLMEAASVDDAILRNQLLYGIPGGELGVPGKKVAIEKN